MYINGVSLDQMQDWYARKIGYVLQLAVPYYEELTVRQNLFFAAHMRLPKKMSHRGKFERVEQVLSEVGHRSVNAEIFTKLAFKIASVWFVCLAPWGRHKQTNQSRKEVRSSRPQAIRRQLECCQVNSRYQHYTCSVYTGNFSDNFRTAMNLDYC